MKPGSIPTLNMPKKSIETSVINERKPRTVVKEHPVRERAYYKHLDDLKSRINDLKTLKDWTLSINEKEILLSYTSTLYQAALPYLTIIIDDGLGFTIQVFNWFLPEDHNIYKMYKRTLKNITLSHLVNICLQFQMCKGIQLESLSSSVISHSIPKSRDVSFECKDEEELKPLVPYEALTFIRSKECKVLINLNTIPESLSQCEE